VVVVVVEVCAGDIHVNKKILILILSLSHKVQKLEKTKQKQTEFRTLF
jgi:hypothetical protein